jgi:hypothetical protein
MTGEEAYQVLNKNTALDVGRFYGMYSNLSLGAGLLYEGVRCPVFNQEDGLFDTIESTGYVITHECDVDANNDRNFNDHVLICPVIPVEDFAAEHLQEFGDAEALRNFLAQVAKRLVSRVVYLPPIGGLRHGGLIYLNNLASAHVSSFEALRPFACVSAYGLQQVDQALTNHLLRPKSERLSFGDR